MAPTLSRQAIQTTAMEETQTEQVRSQIRQPRQPLLPEVRVGLKQAIHNRLQRLRKDKILPLLLPILPPRLLLRHLL